MATKSSGSATEPRAGRSSAKRQAAADESGAPVRDAVRERLLEVARELFARHGVDNVTVRTLAEVADVNVAAVNYYFGSKDGLLLVLFRREARVIVEQRLQRLREAEECKGPLSRQLELFVRALLEPALRWCLQPQVQSLYVPTLLRAVTRGQAGLRAIIERENQNLQPFAVALGKMLPHLPVDEVYWRLHYLLGLEHSFVGDLERLNLLSNGVCDTANVDRMVERTVAFATHGLAFEVASDLGAPARAGRRRAPP